MANRQMQDTTPQMQNGQRLKEHPENKGKKGHGQGGQSGKIQNGQNMQTRDGKKH